MTQHLNKIIAVERIWLGRDFALEPRLTRLLRTVLVDASLVLIGAGIGASTLTFSKVWRHNASRNFFPEFSGEVFYLSDLLVATGIVIWIVTWTMQRRGKFALGPHYVWIPLVALTLFSWVSAFWAFEPSIALWSAARRTLLLAMYFLIVNEAERARRMAAVVLIGFAFIHALVALGQLYQHSALGLGYLGELRPGMLHYESVGLSRGWGLGFNPNPVGFLIAVGAVVSYGLLVFRRNRPSIVGILLVSLVVTLLGVGATGSRSAVIGVVAGVGILTATGLRFADIRYTRIKPYAIHAVLVAITGGGLFLVLFSGNGRVESMVLDRLTWQQITKGFATRSEDYSHSYPIIRATGVVGVGAGNYPLILKEEIAPGVVSPYVLPVHNVFLLLLAELGIVGLVAWIALVGAPIVRFGISQLNGRKLEMREYLWFSVFVVALMESLFDFTPWATQDGRVIFVVLVALWASSVRTKNRRTVGSDDVELIALDRPDAVGTGGVS